MFSSSAQYYDEMYSFKDYRGEAQKLTTIIQGHLGLTGSASSRPRLLDVACGTGRHIEYLKGQFDVEGLDISQELLEIAHQRNPDVTLHCADMIDFDLGRSFEVVTCLFSSIGYVRTRENLARAITCLARHLLRGGVLMIEPWFTPAAWQPGTVHALLVDKPNLKIARVNTSFVDGRLSYFDLHYLIGTPEGTEHLVERHELGLFEMEEMLQVMVDAGLDVTHDPDGLTGRGLFIGRRP